ncbi:hypothetical protein ACLMJK_005495 [Lecanora helva]
MSEVAQNSHEDIHGDYGTLSVTDLRGSQVPPELLFLPFPPLATLLPSLSQKSSHQEVRPPPSFCSSFITKPSSNYEVVHYRTNELLTYRQIRALIRSSASTILSSRRYEHISHNLYHRISEPKFTGYWIIQSSFTDPRPPRHSDITVFFLHGGGYITSHPDTYLLFLLRLAEGILVQDIQVSIFALDYHLAPESPYPKQLEQATAAYEYLYSQMKIPAERIVVAGDSAGGHLALSFLTSLSQRCTLPKPGGVMLFSPWLSLHHYPSTNADSDVLSASFLRATARRFLGPARADWAETMTDPLLEFLSPHPKTDWNTVLPSWLWVLAGTSELMFDDIVTWTQALDKSLGRDRLSWEWGEGELHDWQWLETMDDGAKKRFLQKEGKCDDFEAVMKIARVIAEKHLRTHVRA